MFAELEPRGGLTIVPSPKTGAINDYDPVVLEAQEKLRKIREAKTRDEQLERAVFFELLGDLKPFLDNDLTQNIEVNEDGNVYVQEFGVMPECDANGRPLAIPRAHIPKPKRVALIEYLAGLQYGRAMDALHSELAIDLPLYGARVHCLAEPISNWPLVIRVHAKHVFPLESYVEKGQMSQAHYDFIVQAIDDELNIGVGGAVNSGKTQLLNAILSKKAQLHPGKRGVIVQDRMEVKSDGFANRIEILADVEQAHNEANGSLSRYTYGFAHALRTAMRLNQNFLVWGEVRDDQSAYGLTMAVNTGTPGVIFTIHCKSARHLVKRMEQLIVQGGKKAIRESIADTVEVALHMKYDERTRNRTLAEVVRFRGVDESDNYVYDEI